MKDKVKSLIVGIQKSLTILLDFFCMILYFYFDFYASVIGYSKSACRLNICSDVSSILSIKFKIILSKVKKANCSKADPIGCLNSFE